MARDTSTWRSRADFRNAPGVLLVLRPPADAPPPAAGQPPAVPADPAEGLEVLLALLDDGQVIALAGHVDLGTGLATAYGQIVAEELDLPPAAVQVILGDTARAPHQGATIASSSIQLHAQPLRSAAAQAKAWLLTQAAAHSGAAVADLLTQHGAVITPDAQHLTYAALVAGQHVELLLALTTPTKPVADYTLVGTSAPRTDLPAKATAQAVYVHDQRLPGMLHGRVLRPPYAGLDAGHFVGRSLLAVDAASIAHIPGIEKLVVIGDFIGIVAQREDQADAAMHALQVSWAAHTPSPPLDDLAQALSAHPSTARVVAQQGDVDAALAGATQRLDRQYVWPYQLHASVGPSCALADWASGNPTVWAGTQNPHALRADLALLTGLPAATIEVIRLEAAGCYGRNSADDVAADALLLSRAVGRPVRVQLTRAQEHLWEPKGAAQLMTVRGGLAADGAPAAYDFATSYPSNGAPTLALLLTGAVPAVANAFEMGDRTAVPPYAMPHQRITVHDMAPILRASWLRGVSALPNSFAHESYIDELAHAAGADPVAYRLQHLPDARAAELLRATADRAGWLPHTTPMGQPAQGTHGEWRQGQGVAYARYIHSKFPGFGAAWAAWVADVQVNTVTGEVQVKRVVVGQDAGLMVNPLGVAQQVHGNVLQTTSRALKERLRVDASTGTVASREWGSYPILHFREVPVVDVLLLPRPGEPALGVGESASVPGTAAIANAIFDATGVRLRSPPFTPEVVRAALRPQAGAADVAGRSTGSQQAAPAPPPPALSSAPPTRNPQRRRRPWWAVVSAGAAALVGLFTTALGWRPAIAPVLATAQGLYSPAVIERGRQLAAVGNCVACHTADGLTPNTGGRPLHTPFGTVYSSNLTPDPVSGIGLWSFSAFQRAMRQGVSRDGHLLYPAFPYTAFSQATDDDLTALYAWLMVQPAVASSPPVTDLRFPFNLRPLMGLWNALYLQPGPVASPHAEAAPSRSPQWWRGAALVNGLGHCSACHSPRNALGAERSSANLGGALVDGWHAPALGALARPPVRWTETAMQQYLRQGHHAQHGIAAGPMASVVQALAQADAVDVAAMAHYLVSLQADGSSAGADQDAQRLLASAETQAARTLPGPTQRLFESACGACHHAGDGPAVAGLNQPLALNPKLHSAQADGLVRAVLDGLWQPAFPAIGHMPAFRHALDDAQVVELAAWLRQRFAPGQPAWADLPATVARLRAAGQ